MGKLKSHIVFPSLIKARITGLSGATATGYKFKPVIVGKAANPRAFKLLKAKNQTVSDLPIH